MSRETKVSLTILGIGFLLGTAVTSWLVLLTDTRIVPALVFGLSTWTFWNLANSFASEHLNWYVEKLRKWISD